MEVLEMWSLIEWKRIDPELHLILCENLDMGNVAQIPQFLMFYKKKVFLIVKPSVAHAIL